MKTRRVSTSAADLDLQVWMKSCEWETKKRLDITARVEREGQKDIEKENYDSVIEDVRKYLSEKRTKYSQFMPIPEYFKIIKDNVVTEETTENAGNNLFLLENMKQMGFTSCSLKIQEGLDYKQSVLAVVTLGRFHAASYCFRKEKIESMTLQYPSLRKKAWAPKIPKEAVLRLEDIFQASSNYSKYSKIFLDAAKGEKTRFGENSEQFGVLCHGNILIENILLKYQTDDNCKLSCTELVFSDLSKSFFGSCVLDLLQLIFTAIDQNVRENFMADLVCSVYYDSFAKNVASINNNISMFSKKDFIKEFNLNIMYGFLLSLKISSDLHQNALDKEKVTSANYVKHKDYVLALVRDIVQFTRNAKSSIS